MRDSIVTFCCPTMRLTRPQRLQAHGLLFAFVVGGVGYPLAHAVEHYLYDHGHAAAACSHSHHHDDEVAFSADRTEADHDHFNCAYCPALSPSLSALSTDTAVHTGRIDVVDDTTVLPIVASVHHNAPPRGPPSQG
ncbi:MAG: DUF2946 family protein [Bacteroidota bacterium]